MLGLACAWFAVAAGLACVDAEARVLEPRRWTHLPTGVNLIGVGIGAVDGEISFDPVLRVEDGTFDLYSLGASYVRTFEWLGRSSRLDISLPYARGRWEGTVNGEYTSLRRDGFADPSIRLSMHLAGSPPLRGREFLDYRAAHPVTTSVGAALSITLPWGEYLDDRLINLGGNRFVVRPQIGLLHQRGPWEFELTGSVSFYEDNPAFFRGSRLEQDPLFFLQGHVIRRFGRTAWAGVSAGYSHGGEATIDGVAKDNDDRSRYFALSVGAALSPRATVKLAWATVDTNILLGTRSKALVLSTTYAWGAK